MTHTLNFQDIPLASPFLNDVSGVSSTGSSSWLDHTIELLVIAFDHGGYIAGGFAVLYARWLLSAKAIRHRANIPASSLDYLMVQVHQQLGYKRLGYQGDIDVWFPNSGALEAFLKDERRLRLFADGYCEAGNTITGCALEHVVDGYIRVQVITRFLAPVHDQLACFDIYNASCAVTNTTLTVPQYWVELEDEQTLHVSTWKSPYTINRVFKYLWKKGYQHVTPVTAQHLYAEALAAIEWAATQGNDVACDPHSIRYNQLRKTMVLHPKRMMNLIKPLIPQLSGEQLLELSALVQSPDNYDIALAELTRRMQVINL